MGINDYSSQFREILLTVVEGVEELHSRRNSEAAQKISKNIICKVDIWRDLRYTKEIERVIDAEKFHFAWKRPLDLVINRCEAVGIN